jgi:hypothetical protein
MSSGLDNVATNEKPDSEEIKIVVDDSKKELEHGGQQGSGYMGDSPEVYTEKKFKSKMIEIKKKAGLLDDPSNLLDIGTTYYYNNKKMENLTDYDAQLKLKKEYNSTIVANGEIEFMRAYKEIDDDEQFKDLSREKKQKIATAMMKMKLLESAEIEKVSYPFLS